MMQHENNRLPKLVRDRIPEIISASGKLPVTRTLDDAEYLAALEQKLAEEYAEYRQDGSLEELADMLEVMYALASARGWSPSTLELVRAKKAEQRGTFRARIMLESIIEQEQTEV